MGNITYLVELDGFHGTNSSNYESIKINNFKASLGDKEWLGDGAYFFIDGISDTPDKNALDWAKATAWDKKDRKYTYTECAIIVAKIKVLEDSNLLDLTTLDGIKIFNYIRERYVEKLKSARKYIKNIPSKILTNSPREFLDGRLINDARREGFLDIQVSKGNFYIKFTNERIYGIATRTPNVTICCVHAPIVNISKDDIILKEKRNF